MPAFTRASARGSFPPAGTHHPPEAYLCDKLFKDLLSSRTSFADVCEALRSGALADQFLCASQDRLTRTAGSHLNEDRDARDSQGRSPAARAAVAAAAGLAEVPSHSAQIQVGKQAEEGGLQRAGAAERQQHAQQGPPPAQRPAEQAASPPVSPDDPSPAKRKPMRWVEWPLQGGGQFVSCISERALKSNMTLPSRMKQELFQTSEAAVQIAAHDLEPGSSLRWAWEVGGPARARGAQAAS
jgi:hypothetical protein